MLTGKDLAAILKRKPTQTLGELLALILSLDESVHFTEGLLLQAPLTKHRAMTLALIYLKQKELGLDRVKKDVADIVNSIN